MSKGREENLGSLGIEVADTFVYVGILGVIRLHEISGGKKRAAHVLHVVLTDGMCEDREKIFDAGSRRPHALGIVESRVHVAGVDMAPAVAKTIRIEAIHMKTFLFGPLEHS